MRLKYHIFLLCALVYVLTASGYSAQASDFVLLNVHVAEDLHGFSGELGCDIWKSQSIACRWAVSNYCKKKGYAGGYGPIEWRGPFATVMCAQKTAGEYKEIAYKDHCSKVNPSSLYCENLAHYGCKKLGYAAATGVIGANSNVIATICLKSSDSIKNVSFASVTDLSKTSTRACSADDIVKGNNCQHASNRYCKTLNYSTGVDVFDFDASSGRGSLTCIKASYIETGIKPANSLGVNGYIRPAKIGSMILGGATTTGEVSTADGIINNYNYPIMITSIVPKSNYVGNSYSRDMCFYLNRNGIFQFDNSDDGESMCTYSGQSSDPSIMFRPNAGYLLNPGERFYFQGTPQWGSSGVGLHVMAKIVVAAVGRESIPLRRVRFPKWDTNYPATRVPAGCVDATCATPRTVPPGKPAISSNWWYKPAASTYIRGVSFFANNKRISGCIRVTQNGQNIRTPWCFDFREHVPGPELFSNVFGIYQNGSSFVPLDISVPAGAAVGLDYTLGDGGDLAAYVYLDQRK